MCERRRRDRDLSSIFRDLQKEAVPFLFTDRPSFTRGAKFSSDLANLDRIDWRFAESRFQ